MKTKFTSMKNQLATPDNGSKTCEKPKLLCCRKPVLARLIQLLCAATLMLPAFGTRAGVVFTNLYSFTGTNDGATPNGLVQGSDGYFYGTTQLGGTNNLGTVFKISSSGALTGLYSFAGAHDGATPQAGLVQGSDGNLYGTTESGGPYTNRFGVGYGTVFKISTNGMLTNLYYFTGGDDGAKPQAGLVQGSDGIFYGTTSNGGTNNLGIVFKIGTDGAMTNLHSFAGDDGAYPSAGMVQGSDGYFYGTTQGGGTNGGGYGTVFKISTNGVLTSLHSFTGDDGLYPYAGLVKGSDGYFYGTTIQTYIGGSYGFGTVFKISTNGALTSLYFFTGGNNGGNPYAGLVQGNDGNLYGTTTSSDTVFEVSTNGALTTLYAFTGGLDGSIPYAGLVQGTDGNFYGTTHGGGQGGAGTVFRLTIVPAAPVILAMTITNGILTLSWSTEPGGIYQVQYKNHDSDLSSPNWNNLGGTLIAPGTTLSTSDPTIAGEPLLRFYRVKRWQ
jgi:uncharacterized repeat protein (TIGR03803 family)